jgi:hypothetical protein
VCVCTFQSTGPQDASTRDFDDGRVLFSSFWPDFKFYMQNYHTIWSLTSGTSYVLSTPPYASSAEFLKTYRQLSPLALLLSLCECDPCTRTPLVLMGSFRVCSCLLLSFAAAHPKFPLNTATKITTFLAILSFSFFLMSYSALLLDCEACAKAQSCTQCTVVNDLLDFNESLVGNRTRSIYPPQNQGILVSLIRVFTTSVDPSVEVRMFWYL